MDVTSSNSPCSSNTLTTASSPCDSIPPSAHSYEVLTCDHNVEVRVYQDDLYEVLGMVKEKVLGGGSSGEVILARNPKDRRQTMAIKRFVPRSGNVDATINYFIQEVANTRKLSHPHIVSGLMPIKCPQNLVICMKFYPQGDLDRHIGHLTLEQIQMFFIQLACAVRHMHKRNIIHRDIKLDNIFVKDQRHILLGDFGLARQLPPGQRFVGGHVGTRTFMAPEVRHYHPRKSPASYDGFLADSYSCGVVLWSLLLDVYPKAETYFMEGLNVFKDRLDPFLCKCAMDLLLDNADDRASVAGVLDFLQSHNYSSGLIESL